MPLNTARFSLHGRRRPSFRRASSGKKGPMKFHCSSGGHGDEAHPEGPFRQNGTASSSYRRRRAFSSRNGVTRDFTVESRHRATPDRLRTVKEDHGAAETSMKAVRRETRRLVRRWHLVLFLALCLRPPLIAQDDWTVRVDGRQMRVRTVGAGRCAAAGCRLREWGWYRAECLVTRLTERF
jgi:hypothetical protein